MLVDQVIIALAELAALAAGATALRYPRLCFGILFLVAAMSRETLETPLGTMRPEMPAVVVVAAILLAGGRFGNLRHLPRTTQAMCLAFGAYLAVLAISSAFVAPGRSQSLHWVGWLALSMLSGVVAFVLVRPRPLGAIQPLAFGGAAMGALGIVVAGVFLAVGPDVNPGIQDWNSALPRVFGAAWEANLYASFLAICAFFALEAARGPRRLAGLVMLAAVLIGFPLGITRGAYLGLLAGALAYVFVRLVIERRPVDLLRYGSVSTALVVVGIAASAVMLPNLLHRPPPGPVAVASTGPSATPGPSASPGLTPSPSPTAVATPAPTLALPSTPDTVAYRMERVNLAVGELPQSPLIGFGATSFGQRHPDRYNGPGPDYIAVMGVAVLYESGIVGATALGLGFLLLLWSLWIAARRFAAQNNTRGVGACAAFIAAIACMLVAYQATSAYQFAVNWIILGAAAALAVSQTAKVTPAGEDWLVRPHTAATPARPQEGQNTKLDT
jgi:hypothetical protein